MTVAEATQVAALGFLTVLEHEQLGLVGGYLILNTAGRPLEFHCTAPVKANRAQQILFGPTLDSYLFGEQIGQTLLTKGSLTPLAVYTDVERVLAVRDFVSTPVALVIASSEADGVERPAMSSGFAWRAEVARRAGSHLTAFPYGRNQLAVSSGRDADRAAILDHQEELAAFDLAEPFERIREAVEEAHKSSRAA
jgi:hypothetical protein